MDSCGDIAPPGENDLAPCSTKR